MRLQTPCDPVIVEILVTRTQSLYTRRETTGGERLVNPIDKKNLKRVSQLHRNYVSKLSARAEFLENKENILDMCVPLRGESRSQITQERVVWNSENKGIAPEPQLLTLFKACGSTSMREGMGLWCNINLLRSSTH